MSFMCLQHALIACQADASPHRSWPSHGDNFPAANANESGHANTAAASTVGGQGETGITTIMVTTTIFQIQTHMQTQTEMVHLKQLEVEKAILTGITGDSHRDCCSITRHSNAVF